MGNLETGTRGVRGGEKDSLSESTAKHVESHGGLSREKCFQLCSHRPKLRIWEMSDGNIFVSDDMEHLFLVCNSLSPQDRI